MKKYRYNTWSTQFVHPLLPRNLTTRLINPVVIQREFVREKKCGRGQDFRVP